MKCLKCDRNVKCTDGRVFIEIQYYQQNDKSYSLKQKQVERIQLCAECTRAYYKVIDNFLGSNEVSKGELQC